MNMKYKKGKGDIIVNNYFCVGRLVNEPEVKELEDGKKVTNITIAVPRSYKNANGEYETDFIDCTIWNNVAESTSEYCKKGDMIGIKGRIETSIYEKDDGEKVKRTSVVADRVSFLSSKTKEIKDTEPEME